MIRGSSFLAFGSPTQWSREHGIARAHWDAFLNYAFAKDYYVFIRGGKARAIDWIERGFPGKPMELGFLKVDPGLGLLKVVKTADHARVYALGHSVVKEVGHGGTTEHAAFLHDQGRPLSPADRDWAEQGVVVDKVTGKPFTSDYDLWSVVDARDFDYMATIGHDPLLGQPTEEGGKASHTSWLVEEVRSDLNALLESRRFLHGAQVQFIAPEESQNDPERVVGFCPDGKAVYFEGTAGHLEGVFRDIYAHLSGRERGLFEQ